MRAAMIRFVGETCRMLNAKTDLLEPKFRRAIRRVRRPKGWRLKVYLKLRKTVFKRYYFHSGICRRKYFLYGMAEGVWKNQQKEARISLRTQEDKKVFKEVFGHYLPDGSKPCFESLCVNNEPMKTIRQVHDKLEHIAEAKMSDYAEGLRSAKEAMFTKDFNLRYGEDASQIYLFLLLIGDLVNKRPSMEALYRFAKQRMGSDLPHKIHSFTQVCNRVGIRGGSKVPEVERYRVSALPA